MPDKINQVFAFLVQDEDNMGGEGIAGFMDGNGRWWPLVGGRFSMIDQMRPVAQKIADTTGKTIECVTFTQRESVETIKPKKG